MPTPKNWALKTAFSKPLEHSADIIKRKQMIVKGWYEPIRDYFVVDFLDDPVFALSPEDAGKKEAWAMFTHGVCAVTLDGGHLRFHRLGVVVQRMGEIDDASLTERLEKASRILGYMGKNPKVLDPNNPTSRQCRLASEALTQHQDYLVASCMQSYRCAKGSN